MENSNEIQVNILKNGYGRNIHSIIRNTDYICNAARITKEEFIDEFSRYISLTKRAFSIDEDGNIKINITIRPIDVRFFLQNRL